jgi:hypothetical protein
MRIVGKARDGRRIRFNAGVSACIECWHVQVFNAGGNAGIVGPVASLAGLAVSNDLGHFGLVRGHSEC